MYLLFGEKVGKKFQNLVWKVREKNLGDSLDTLVLVIGKTFTVT